MSTCGVTMIRFNFQAPDVHVEYFIGAETNVCYNAIDAHIMAGHGDKVALIWEGNDPSDDTKLTFVELQKEVSRPSSHGAFDTQQRREQEGSCCDGVLCWGI